MYLQISKNCEAPKRFFILVGNFKYLQISWICAFRGTNARILYFISFSVLCIITFEFLLNVIRILSFLRKRNYWYFDFSVLSFSQIWCVCFMIIFSLQEFSVFGFLIIRLYIFSYQGGVLSYQFLSF